MKKKVYLCDKCKGIINNSMAFCPHCGSQFDSEEFDANLGFSVKKENVEKVKQELKKIDPRVKFSSFIPMSKAMKGVLIKTSDIDKIKTYLQSEGIRIVSGKDLGYSNM